MTLELIKRIFAKVKIRKVLYRYPHNNGFISSIKKSFACPVWS